MSTTGQYNGSEWDFDNLPNRLTIFRILLVPFVIGALLMTQLDFPFVQKWQDQLKWFAGGLFAIAGTTDFFDGYIARKKNIVTIFGSFLDPIADKFLVVSSLIALMALTKIPPVIVIILVLREFYMTSLRLLATNQGIIIPVGSMGKYKTTAQMVGIEFLMLPDKVGFVSLKLIGTIAIYAASILSLYSATTYSIGMFKKLQLKKSKRKQPHG